MQQIPLFTFECVRMGNSWFLVIHYWTGNWTVVQPISRDRAIRILKDKQKHAAEEEITSK